MPASLSEYITDSLLPETNNNMVGTNKAEGTVTLCYNPNGGFESFQCLCSCAQVHGLKWLGCNAIRRPAGVTQEVNLRIMQAMKHRSEGSTLILKPRVDTIRSSKRGYQWLTKIIYVLQKFLKRHPDWGFNQVPAHV